MNKPILSVEALFNVTENELCWSVYKQALAHIEQLQRTPSNTAIAEPRSKLADELEALRAFRSAVVGWRENDWPERFDRRTAELVAVLGEDAYQARIARGGAT